MKEQPLVSVCIPAFQHASFISECLDSVLAQQTNFAFEIILGEDDSKDGTREICQRYSSQYPEKIRLFLRKDKDKISLLGRKSGRTNYLENFRSANGKYIAMLDGDDCWLSKDKLQKQVELLEDNPDAFLCSSEYLMSSKTPEKDLSGQFTFTSNFFPKNRLDTMSYSGHVSNWMFRNDLGEFLSSPAARKGPILDLLLFSYFKTKGGLVHWDCPSSFYRKNEKSYHVQKGLKSRNKELFWSAWYQFRYIHRDPIKWLRLMGYLGKKVLRQYSN